MAEDWYSSPAFQELMRAHRTGDVAGQNEIISQQIGQSTGADKAFWVIQRAIIRTRHTQLVMDPTWNDLDEALQLAPGDERIEEQVLLHALALTVSTEHLEGLRTVLHRLKPGLRRILPNHPFVQANLALLQLKQGHFRAAFDRLSHTFRLIEALGPEWLRHRTGFMPPLYAERARAAFRIGLMAEGANDLERVEAACRERPEAVISRFFLALAQAEQSFQQRHYHAARRNLQQAMTLAVKGGSRVVSPVIQVEAELIAARIAGAEGNAEAVTYYCDRAVGLIAHLDRPLTAAQIEAVRRDVGGPS